MEAREWNRAAVVAAFGVFVTALSGVVGNVVADHPRSPTGWSTLGALVAIEVVIVIASLRRSTPTELVTESAVDALAQAVREQWEEEATTREIERPASIRVRWRDTERPVTASAEAILGQPLEGEPHRFRFEGDVHSVAEAFLGLPRRQLCVIGKPGGGKTVLLLLLTLRLLDGRSPGANVPVMFTLSSWDPRETDLEDWLTERLREDYVFLRSRRYGEDAARTLISNRQVIAVLDGLDEIAESLRPHAIEKIDRAMAKGMQVAVTCRGDEFEEAVRSEHRFLSTAPVVEIQDVRPHEAEAFLVESTPDGHARWSGILSALESHRDSPAAQALETPLMLWLAREVYRSPATDPSELLDEQRFATKEALEGHLLDAFIPVAYARDLSHTHPHLPRWNSQRAERWLRALATNLYRNRRRRLGWRSGPTWSVPPAIDFDFRWWEIYRAMPNWWAGGVCLIYGVPIAIFPPLLILLATDTYTMTRGVALSCIAVGGILIAIFYRPRPPGRIHVGRASWREVKIRARESIQLGVLAFGLVAPSVAIAFLATHQPGAISNAIVVGVTGASGVLITGLLNGPVDTVRAQSPRRVLFGDRWVAVCTAVLGAVTALVTISRSGGGGLIPGLAAAIAAAIAATIGMSSWGWFLLARVYFWSTRQAPWRIFAFLEDAHARSVLRQVGSVYQFRHRRLQERLDERGKPRFITLRRAGR